MKILSLGLKAAVATAGLVAVVGCAPGYCDDYGCHNYYRHGYYDHDGYYHRDGDRYRERDGDRRWVCDSDGDDCHWTYAH